MAEFIPAVVHTGFPFPRHFKEDAAKPKKRKSEFQEWLGAKPVNANDEPADMPMLSMEDELMLAKLRELARPQTLDASSDIAVNPYLKAAEAGAPQEQSAGDEIQYELPLVLTPSGELINEQI